MTARFSSYSLSLSRYLFIKGCRVTIRGKVNEGINTGLRVVDTIIVVGCGQRELIIGDRATGKTSIYLNSILTHNSTNLLFGNKRCNFSLICVANIKRQKYNS